jgi:hypothetical protein
MDPSHFEPLTLEAPTRVLQGGIRCRGYSIAVQMGASPAVAPVLR